MNMPNALSILRLIMVPGFAIVFFKGGQYAYYFAALIYIFAALTDVLDGYLARKYNKITRLGRILDPLADKLMAFTALVCIFIDGKAPTWAVIVFFCKEALMGIGALSMYNKVSDLISSDKWGKGATVTFFIALIIVMLFKELPPLAVNIILAIPISLSIAALVHYYKLYRKVVQK